MDRYIARELKELYDNEDEKSKLKTRYLYQRTDSLYRYLWRKIVDKVKYRNELVKGKKYKLEGLKFTVYLENTKYSSTFSYIDFNVVLSENDTKFVMFSEKLCEDTKKGERILCLDRLVDMLIKDGFDVNEIKDNTIRFGISIRQLDFLKDTLGINREENDERYYKLKLPKKESNND